MEDSVYISISLILTGYLLLSLFNIGEELVRATIKYASKTTTGGQDL